MEKRTMLTNREVFCPTGLEGKEWAGWGEWEGHVPGRREEAGGELHPVLTGIHQPRNREGRGR